VPQPTVSADDSKYKISGIMPDPAVNGKYGAILNGRVVYEDHYIDGAIVKRIERDRVTLDVSGREVIVRLY
jgi:hypothetical protein